MVVAIRMIIISNPITPKISVGSREMLILSRFLDEVTESASAPKDNPFRLAEADFSVLLAAFWTMLLPTLWAIGLTIK